MTPQDRAKALVQSFRHDDHGGYDLSFIWLEQAIAQALHAERVTVWEEAALYWDTAAEGPCKDGDDFVWACRVAQWCREQAHKVQP